jgi:heme-degrading monooxygenase HmoA
MYMNRNEAEITLGRNADFEASVEDWATIQGQNAGFVGATLLQAYANPGRYTLFSRWTDRDASMAAGRREQFTSFVRGLLTSGMLRPVRLTEAYESVFEVDTENAESAASSAERWIDFNLNMPMIAPAFEEGMRQLAEASIQHAPGIVSVRLRRSAGNDLKYLMIVFAADRAAARGWLLVPQIRELMEAQGLTQYLSSPPSAEIHHVVKRYAGPAASTAQQAAAAARVS